MVKTHIFESHSPYEPAEPFKSRYENPYDGEIATADAVVGKLLDFLKSSGIYDRAIVVGLSEHGEGLGVHGEQEQGMFLYTEVIRVPLMVKLPGSPLAGSTVYRRVQLIDLMPTVAALTGVGARRG